MGTFLKVISLKKGKEKERKGMLLFFVNWMKKKFKGKTCGL
jgi:hypothetical protein